MFDYYAHPRMLAKCEIAQAASLGHDVASLKSALEALPKEDTPETLAQARAIYERALMLGLPADWKYVEPAQLEEMRRERPERPRLRECRLSDDELYDRILGAWLGRAAGCLLGKPVEGWSRECIRQALEKVNSWPLDYYFPPLAADTGAGYQGFPREWSRGNITRAVRDDDTDYTILGLLLLESKGPDFTLKDVADLLLSNLPFRKVYTAERTAYRNLILGFDPPETARHDNPYREWIGAQIRADIFGYVSPGRPEVAAGLACREGGFSHQGNAVYGAMWAAGMLAAAFTSDDAEEVIRVGLGEIPGRSRLAEAIGKVLRWRREEGDPPPHTRSGGQAPPPLKGSGGQAPPPLIGSGGQVWQSVRDHIERDYGALHGVHVINNSCNVALALLTSRGDFGRGVCAAVMGGWDTDCTGATVGSILGAMMGAKRLPAQWIEPLHDTLDSAIFGHSTVSISSLARRTLAVAKKMSLPSAGR